MRATCHGQFIPVTWSPHSTFENQDLCPKMQFSSSSCNFGPFYESAFFTVLFDTLFFPCV